MIRRTLIAAALATCMLVPTLSHAKDAATPISVESGMLVGKGGMTLYTYDNDAAGSGKSSCNGPCAKNWPPLMAGASDMAAGDYSIVVRDDGSKQWAYKGKPLYYWVKDTKPGQTGGDGMKDVWHVAKP